MKTNLDDSTEYHHGYALTIPRQLVLVSKEIETSLKRHMIHRSDSADKAKSLFPWQCVDNTTRIPRHLKAVSGWLSRELLPETQSYLLSERHQDPCRRETSTLAQLQYVYFREKALKDELLESYHYLTQDKMKSFAGSTERRNL